MKIIIQSLMTISLIVIILLIGYIMEFIINVGSVEQFLLVAILSYLIYWKLDEM